MGIGAVIGSGILGAGSQIFGSIMGSNAQKKGAQAQANAITAAVNQMAQYLKPYRDAGQPYADYLKTNLDDLIAPIKLDQKSLEQTPGYGFTLQQGLKAVQNSAAARGLGSSGAAYKGAGEYATGLANQTWKDVFAAENTNKSNTWNRLLAGAGLGANAAAATGQGALQGGFGVGGSLMTGANAEANGWNNIGKSLGGLFSNIGGYYGNQLLKAGGAGATGTPSPGMYDPQSGFAAPWARY